MVSSRKRWLLWWSRSGFSVRLSLFAAVGLLLLTLLYLQRPVTEGTYIPSNVAVFTIVNLIVAVLLVLVFLVGRNLYQILFERKHRVVGSRLRLRLVGAIVGLTAVPAVLLVAVSSGLLTRAIDGWFSSPAESSVEAAKEVGRIYFGSLKARVGRQAKLLSEELQSRQLEFAGAQDLSGFLERKRVAEDIYAIEIFGAEGSLLVKVENATASLAAFAAPLLDQQLVVDSLQKSAEVIAQETPSSHFVRALQPMVFNDQAALLVVTLRLRPEMTLALDTIRQSYQEYLQLQHYKNPLRWTYILNLYLVAGLVLFAAMWLGIHIARQLTIPIQKLSAAMHDVAEGNFGRLVHHKGDDELAQLTESFNRMTVQLRNSTAQAEQRRVYLETVLSTLAVGVVVLDKSKNIIGVNAAALRIFGSDRQALDVEGSPVESIVPSEIWGEVEGVLRRFDEPHAGQGASYQEHEIVFHREGWERRVLLTGGALLFRSGESLGNVLILDDVTALSEAQRLAAWREAARRIAHEIKNPLTPIQLAAQRLDRTFQGDSGPSAQTVADATNTILEHVSSIKRLADEFSRFARMPALHVQPSDLRTIVHEVVLAYVENDAGISFQGILDDNVPPVEVDPEQIRRVLMNLIENAVRALSDDPGRRDDARGALDAKRVLVKLTYDKGHDLVSLEVCDNGPGIPEEDRGRVFEPYFTRHKGGTGLGLAIVATIVSEHGGQIRIMDFKPRGTRVVITLPRVHNISTQRKFDFSAA